MFSYHLARPKFCNMSHILATPSLSFYTRMAAQFATSLAQIYNKIFCKSLTGAWPYIFQLVSKPVLPSYTAEVFSYEILASIPARYFPTLSYF